MLDLISKVIDIAVIFIFLAGLIGKSHGSEGLPDFTHNPESKKFLVSCSTLGDTYRGKIIARFPKLLSGDDSYPMFGRYPEKTPQDKETLIKACDTWKEGRTSLPYPIRKAFERPKENQEWLRLHPGFGR